MDAVIRGPHLAALTGEAMDGDDTSDKRGSGGESAIEEQVLTPL